MMTFTIVLLFFVYDKMSLLCVVIMKFHYFIPFLILIFYILCFLIIVVLSHISSVAIYLSFFVFMEVFFANQG